MEKRRMPRPAKKNLQAAALAAAAAMVTPHMEGKAHAADTSDRQEFRENIQEIQGALDVMSSTVKLHRDGTKLSGKQERAVRTALDTLSANKSLVLHQQETAGLAGLVRENIDDGITKEARAMLIDAISDLDKIAAAIVDDLQDGQLDDERLLNDREGGFLVTPDDLLECAKMTKDLQLEQHGGLSVAQLAQDNEDFADGINIRYSDGLTRGRDGEVYDATVVKTWTLVSPEAARQSADRVLAARVPEMAEYTRTYTAKHPRETAEDQVTVVQGGDQHYWTVKTNTALTMGSDLLSTAYTGSDMARILQAGGYTYDEAEQAFQPLIDTAVEVHNAEVFVAAQWTIHNGTEGDQQALERLSVDSKDSEWTW